MPIEFNCFIFNHKFNKLNPQYCLRCKRMIGLTDPTTLPEFIKDTYNGIKRFFTGDGNAT